MPQHSVITVIGSRFYKYGFQSEFQGNITEYFMYSDNPSPLDMVGHGSHIASRAARSFMANATYFGHNFGTFRGGAPRARLAIYKGQSSMTRDGIGFKDLTFLGAFYRRNCHDCGSAPDDITIFAFYTSNNSVAGIPVIQIDYETGTEIMNYCLTSDATPMVKLSSTKVLLGKPGAPRVASYSSREPNSYVPSVLKPDIAAPGTSILAVNAYSNFMMHNTYSLSSGTSNATPHVAGIVALLRAVHPDWSPAAIKSALVTTAWNTDTYDYPIFAESNPRKLADAFDYGGGIANPNGAAHPADDPEIQNVTGIRGMCPKPIMSVLDLNLPSITIPNLRESVTVKRTVTNVGLPAKAVYNSVIKTPLVTKVSVKPKVLSFNYGIKKITFQVTIKLTKKYNLGYTFGSLTWTDGKHSIRSPISVKTEIVPLY
ncbi:unnamed protein product [Fraxinus pennsylvanica]|uniref:Uncharacterized protein n=1 Tax=Fraxinus pennsylvanica TaxID=56036 RepID=A0AAD2A788_9LAMI|nr:unnamed protein product [Fraxinus pennsylvanica]